MWPRQRQTLSTAACQRHATRQSNENPTPLSTKATATAKHCNSRGLKLQRRTLSLRASLRSQCAPPHCEALSEPVENSLSSSSHACKSRACKISRRPPGLHARSSHARVRLSRLPPPTLSLCVNLSARAATPPSQPLSSVRLPLACSAWSCSVVLALHVCMSCSFINSLMWNGIGVYIKDWATYSGQPYTHNADHSPPSRSEGHLSAHRETPSATH